MDWQALQLSLQLSAMTVAILIPIGVLTAFFLQRSSFYQSAMWETFFTLPLVLPPTVLGYYLLVAFSQEGLLGHAIMQYTNQSLVFSFIGILLASLVFNLPFAILPIRRAFESIPESLQDAAKTCGLGPWHQLWKIQLPLSWRGVVTASIMTFTHTLGEFGVILMVGGNIPKQTRTISISIYDAMQSLQMASAGRMSLFLLILSFLSLIFTQFFLNRSNSIFSQSSHA